MVPDLFREFAFSLTDVSAKAAQAAHDARQPEVDRLKALNAELVKVLRDGAAYLEAHRCWLKSDANPATRGAPLPIREQAAAQVSGVLDRIYVAIASAERAGR